MTPRTPASSHRIGAIILIGFLGFFSGGVGGLTAAAFLIPTTSTVIPAFLQRASPAPSAPSLASVMGATVDVFTVEASDAIPALVPFASRVGRGVAITDDGWIATVGEVIRSARAGRRVPIVVGRDRQVRTVDRMAFDPISDLVFLHVPELRATALPFHARERLRLGALLTIPTGENGMVTVALRSLSASIASTALHSSDAWATALAFAPLADVPLGSPVVDASGAVVGILQSSDRALPIDAVTSVLPTLLARGIVERNTIGMTYRDLAEFGRLDRDGEGIVIERARVGAPLFAPGSPLTGRLAAGDRILAVGDEQLTALRHIAELLQEYPVGATVPFDVLRRGQRSTIPVTLVVQRGETLLVAAPRARVP